MELNSPEELSKPIQNARLKVILPARKETGEYLDTDCISLEMGSAPGRHSFFDILSLPGLWAAWAPASNASSKVPSASLQLLAAPEPRCRTHGPPRGRVLVPAFPRLWLLGAIVQARGALPPQSGRAALRSFPPRRARNSGRRSLPCSRLRHDLSKAASRAAAASSSRRRHVFLPYTWPCHRSRRLCSSRLLQMSEADGRQVPLQLLPLRGRLRELPSARALLDTESPYPSAAATASSVFLTEPKPPPSWFAPQ